LQLNDSSVLTEGAAIVQYLADLKPEAGLIPPAGSAERYRCIAWLNFIATELHKMYSPWLFHPEYGAEAQDIARAKIRDRLAHVERTLVQGGPFLMGETFTVADAYLFTVVGWSHVAKVDLTPFPRLGEFIALVRARPTVRAALEAEARIAKRRHVA
jgi:glutathione S-transferase